jgi:hypothetical protein
MTKVLSVGALEHYVHQILELEHGKVSDDKITPPLSRKGSLLTNSENKGEARRIANDAEYIISLCRLELDIMCGPWNPSETLVDVHEDTEAFFKQLLKSIQVLPTPLPDIAFCALAFVCICEEHGIDPTPECLIRALSKYLRQIKGGDEADCTLDKILFATRGVLLLDQPGGPGGDAEVIICPYSSSFTYFISCGYSPLVKKKVTELEKVMEEIELTEQNISQSVVESPSGLNRQTPSPNQAQGLQSNAQYGYTCRIRGEITPLLLEATSKSFIPAKSI